MQDSFCCRSGACKIVLVQARLPLFQEGLFDDDDLNGDRGAQLRDHLVNALTGLMWNIPIVNDFRCSPPLLYHRDVVQVGGMRIQARAFSFFLGS